MGLKDNSLVSNLIEFKPETTKHIDVTSLLADMLFYDMDGLRSAVFLLYKGESPKIQNFKVFPGFLLSFKIEQLNFW